VSGWHGRHWPHEQQNGNYPEGMFALAGEEAAAARVRDRWAAVFPPFDVGSNYIPEPELPEGRC